jgi:hypothetical protein
MAALLSRMLMAGTLFGAMLHCPAYADASAADSPVVLSEAAVNSPFGGALNSDALETLRGGAEVSVKNNSMLDGVVGQNQAYNLSTGSNVITEGSLAGASGVSTVVQNSGNNVLIQNSTIINLQLK